VSTVITGASRPSQVCLFSLSLQGTQYSPQVVENVKAVELVARLTPEILAEIEAAVETKPKALYDWGRGSVRIF
jgi:aryl-alcohol dehydrogenase-like predicted oxidoreductase